MSFQAPLNVTVEVRALDVGPTIERVWRLSRAVGEDGVRLRRDLPWEAGRPVAVTLALPEEDLPVAVTGVVTAVPPDEPELEGEQARPRAIAFTGVDEPTRGRLARYVLERMLSP